jgi:hypothetical protein
MATIRRRKGRYEVPDTSLWTAASIKIVLYAQTCAGLGAPDGRVGRPLRSSSDPRALQQVTLGELVIRYRDTVSVRKRGYEVERLVLNAFLGHPVCKQRLSEITTAHFARYRDERLQSIKPATLKRQLGPIRNLFKIARDHWDLPVRDNPLDKLQLNALDRRRERRLQPGEEAKVVQAAASCRNRLMVPIIAFALETGMRRGEILAIPRDHIDLAGRALLIPETKNGHARTIRFQQPIEGPFRDSEKRGICQGRVDFPAADVNQSRVWSLLIGAVEKAHPLNGGSSSDKRQGSPCCRSC